MRYAAYHTHDAEQNIIKIMKEYQYDVAATKGYMLFAREDEAADDVELRSGVLRAVKYSEKESV